MASGPPPFNPSPSLLSALTNEVSKATAEYATSPSPESLQKILYANRTLTLAATNPAEFFTHFVYQGPANAALRIALSMNLIPSIPSEPGASISLIDLAVACRTDTDFTLRIARALVAIDVLAQAGPLRYAHTPFSRLLLSENLQCFAKHMWDHMVAGLSRLTSYFATHGFKSPSDPWNTPIVFAHGEKNITFFEWLEKDPEGARDFNMGMMGRLNALGSREVVNKYPWESVLSGKGEGVVLVDVGGGKGQLLKEIIRVHGGSIRGGMVLQDLKHVLESETIVGEEDGVELVPYNFLEEVQPVKGAKAYFLKSILHDWPDNECKTILRNLKPALQGHDSRLLLCERVLDDSKPVKQDVLCDINMIAISGKERSIAQWETLLRSEGFEIEKIYGQDDPARMACIIDVRLKDG